jgi:hypothetical protein
MKKISSDEFEQLPIKGKGRSGHVFTSLINLKPGEALLIEKKDWTRKAGPSTLVRYIEKKHNMKFHFGALNGNEGWAVRRIDTTNIQQPVAEDPAKLTAEKERLDLKAALTIFYLGRMAFHKIERIDESAKACIAYFWKKDNVLIKSIFDEVIVTLAEQGHIVIENEKTYIPLQKL